MNNASNRAQIRAREIDMEMRNWLNGGLNREDGRLAIFDTFGEPVNKACLLYTSPSPRDATLSRMPSSA